MTDRPAAHLTDDALNEYLDEALSPAARQRCEAHLAACAACSTRLADLRALFASLDDLPELALTRDLAPAVVAAVQPRRVEPMPARRPWLALVVALQVMIALGAAAVSWTFVAAPLRKLALPALAFVNDFLAAAPDLDSAMGAPAQLLDSLQRGLQAGWPSLWPGAAAAVPLQWLLAVAAGTGLLWVVTNLWLLQQRRGSPLRRTR